MCGHHHPGVSKDPRPQRQRVEVSGPERHPHRPVAGSIEQRRSPHHVEPRIDAEHPAPRPCRQPACSATKPAPEIDRKLVLPKDAVRAERAENVEVVPDVTVHVEERGATRRRRGAGDRPHHVDDRRGQPHCGHIIAHEALIPSASAVPSTRARCHGRRRRVPLSRMGEGRGEGDQPTSSSHHTPPATPPLTAQYPFGIIQPDRTHPTQTGRLMAVIRKKTGNFLEDFRLGQRLPPQGRQDASPRACSTPSPSSR